MIELALSMFVAGFFAGTALMAWTWQDHELSPWKQCRKGQRI